MYYIHTAAAAIENVDTIHECRSKSLEKGFLIAISQQIGNKWQLKTLFLAIFDLGSLIVKSVYNCPLSSVILAVVIVEKSQLMTKTRLIK